MDVSKTVDEFAEKLYTMAQETSDKLSKLNDDFHQSCVDTGCWDSLDDIDSKEFVMGDGDVDILIEQDSVLQQFIEQLKEEIENFYKTKGLKIKRNDLEVCLMEVRGYSDNCEIDESIFSVGVEDD